MGSGGRKQEFFTSCVNLSKFLNFSVQRFPGLKKKGGGEGVGEY